jgi:hypothetical protein
VLDVEKRRGEAGSVEVADGLSGRAGTRASGRANDVAKIVLSVPGEDLPITGPGILWPAAAGLPLVLAGLVLAVRRAHGPTAEVVHRLGK